MNPDHDPTVQLPTFSDPRLREAVQPDTGAIDSTMFGSLSHHPVAMDTLASDIAASRERKITQALSETDWSETAVLRIIEYRPEQQYQPLAGSEDALFSIRHPELRIERYAERAPPVSDYADGERLYSVYTITKPLLDRLFAESDHLFDEVWR